MYRPRVSCGVLQQNQDVWTCGEGTLGQLGHGDTRNRLTPKRVAALHNKFVCWVRTSRAHAHTHAVTVTCEPLVTVECASAACLQVDLGSYHSVALTDDGCLYSWGCGEVGATGHSSDPSKR